MPAQPNQPQPHGTQPVTRPTAPDPECAPNRYTPSDPQAAAAFRVRMLEAWEARPALRQACADWMKIDPTCEPFADARKALSAQLEPLMQDQESERLGRLTAGDRYGSGRTLLNACGERLCEDPELVPLAVAVRKHLSTGLLTKPSAKLRAAQEAVAALEAHAVALRAAEAEEQRLGMMTLEELLRELAGHASAMAVAVLAIGREGPQLFIYCKGPELLAGWCIKRLDDWRDWILKAAPRGGIPRAEATITAQPPADAPPPTFLPLLQEIERRSAVSAVNGLDRNGVEFTAGRGLATATAVLVLRQLDGAYLKYGTEGFMELDLDDPARPQVVEGAQDLEDATAED